MEFEKVIAGRYSTTAFDGRVPDKDVVTRILDAARLAPTACNFQPQKIYVLESEEALAKMDQMTPCRYGAGLALLVCCDRNIAWKMPNGFTSLEQDASIVATHILLAATANGVDNIWCGIFDREKAVKVFDLPENIVPICFIDLGYAAEGSKPRKWHFERKTLGETVEYM